MKKSDIFYRFGDDRIVPKNMRLKLQLYENQKLRKKLRQIHYPKKPFLMVYVGTYDCYEDIKRKL